MSEQKKHVSLEDLDPRIDFFLQYRYYKKSIDNKVFHSKHQMCVGKLPDTYLCFDCQEDLIKEPLFHDCGKKRKKRDFLVGLIERGQVWWYKDMIRTNHLCNEGDIRCCDCGKTFGKEDYHDCDEEKYNKREVGKKQLLEKIKNNPIKNAKYDVLVGNLRKKHITNLFGFVYPLDEEGDPPLHNMTKDGSGWKCFDCEQTIKNPEKHYCGNKRDINGIISKLIEEKRIFEYYGDITYLEYYPEGVQCLECGERYEKYRTIHECHRGKYEHNEREMLCGYGTD